MTNDKTTKGDYQVRIYIRDTFDFAEHQDNCSYGLGYKLTLQRNSDNHVSSHRAVATNADNLALAGRVIIEDRRCYVPHYTTKISNQKIMLGHIVSEAPTELSYIKGLSYMKDVTT